MIDDVYIHILHLLFVNQIFCAPFFQAVFFHLFRHLNFQNLTTSKIFRMSAFWPKRGPQTNFQENLFFCWSPSVPLYRSRCVKWNPCIPYLSVTWPILTPKWGQIKKIFRLSAFWSKRGPQTNFQENLFFFWSPSVPLYRSRCVKSNI